MSSATLYRWSGIALFVGSLVGVVGSVLDAISPRETAQQIVSGPFLIDAALFLIWSLLIVMGLPGLYLRQATRAGALGFAGYIVLSLGLLLGGVGFAIVQVTMFPYLAQKAPKLLPMGGTGPDAGFLLWILLPVLGFAIGNVLLGISTLRAAVFPRGAGVFLILAGFLFLLTITPVPFITPASNGVFFVATAWCGSLLLRPEQEHSELSADAAIQTSR